MRITATPEELETASLTEAFIIGSQSGIRPDDAAGTYMAWERLRGDNPDLFEHADYHELQEWFFRGIALVALSDEPADTVEVDLF